jgi:competence protein ComEA
MFKKFIAALAALLAASAFAAVDVNKASQAELEAVKGIGPAISTSILSERKKGDFKDWNDLVVRVKGVGDKSAAKLSEGGLTVNGKAFAGAPAVETPAKTPVTTKAAEATKETAAKAGTAVKVGADKTASGVKAGAKVVKDNAKEEAHAAKESVADAKAKSDEKKAAKAEAKAEKKAEKAEAKAASASAVKTSASAAKK